MRNLAGDIKELMAGRVRFARLLNICQNHFGKPRIRGSHHIFKTPWPGDPRINLQEEKGGTAKPYQLKQVLEALLKMKEREQDEK